MYGTVAGYKAYHLERDNDIPVATDDEITADLLVASEFLDGRYFSSFMGLKTGGRNQLREWPRQGVVDHYGYAIASDAIPREIENATYEAAWRQRVTPGSLIKDYMPGKYKSVSVDGAVSVTFAGFGGAYDIQTQFAIIDAILAPLLSNGNASFAGFSGDAIRV